MDRLVPTFNGYKVIVIPKVTYKIKRTWWERLTNKPLFKKYKYEESGMVTNDQVIFKDNTFYVTEEQYNRLTKELGI